MVEVVDGRNGDKERKGGREGEKARVGEARDYREKSETVGRSADVIIRSFISPCIVWGSSIFSLTYLHYLSLSLSLDGGTHPRVRIVCSVRIDVRVFTRDACDL